jgi:hypothetical protein
MTSIRVVQALVMNRFRWLALAATAVLAAVAFSTTPARADIIYTFGPNGGDFVTGTMIVSSRVLASGVITPSDIRLLNIEMGPRVGIGDRYGSSPLPSLRIPVSRTTGGFTGPVGTSIFEQGPFGAGLVNTDLNYGVIGGESWTGDFISGSFSGVGSWSVTLINVPEPSPMILAVIGLACACAFRGVSRRRGESG